MKEEKELYIALCGKCGNEIRVPFIPREDRPILCPKCYFELTKDKDAKDNSDD